MLAPNTFLLQETEKCGKGLFAKDTIPAGTVIWFLCQKCELIPWNEIESFSQEKKDFYTEHAFAVSSTEYVMTCGNGKYMNHSCNANMLNYYDLFDIVVRDIPAGKEATYDYRTFSQPRGEYLICQCGEINCCQKMEYHYSLTPNVKVDWEKKLKYAATMAKKVFQPLKKYILSQKPECTSFFREG